MHSEIWPSIALSLPVLVVVLTPVEKNDAVAVIVLQNKVSQTFVLFEELSSLCEKRHTS